mgnify:FL=1
MLTDDQLLRYNRQILLPSWDIAAQTRLATASVLVVGLGGLGCPLAQQLTLAGVGRLLLADFDRVELSNLQRQMLHHDADIGRYKVESARDSLVALRADVIVDVLAERMEEASLLRALARVDVVADCSDNFATRELINRCAWRLKKPVVSAAAIAWQGQLSVFDANHSGSACYRCLYPASDDAALTCSENGVMTTTVAVMGSWQAQEVLKVLTGTGESLCGHLLLWDGRVNEVRRVRTPRDPACPVCSNQGDVLS